MISARQWQYIYSRLQITPNKLLSRLELYDYSPSLIQSRIGALNTICRRKLQLSIADLIVESESVWNIFELAQISGLNRSTILQRIHKWRIKKITSFPTVHILQQDLWSVMKLPKLSTLLKSNPLFQYRYNGRTSIITLASQLSITPIELTKLEYGSLYPTIQLCSSLAALDPTLPLHLRLWFDLYHRSTL